MAEFYNFANFWPKASYKRCQLWAVAHDPYEYTRPIVLQIDREDGKQAGITLTYGEAQLLLAQLSQRVAASRGDQFCRQSGPGQAPPIDDRMNVDVVRIWAGHFRESGMDPPVCAHCDCVIAPYKHAWVAVTTSGRYLHLHKCFLAYLEKRRFK